MKIRKIHIAYFIFLMFIAYGLSNIIFERIFYFNEILAFFGILIFLIKGFNQKLYWIIPKSRVYKLVLLFILLGIVHLLFSFPVRTNLYFYFRGSVIVYSAFAFFVGFYLFKYQEYFIRRIRKTLAFYLFYGLTFPREYLIERFMGAAFFPFLFKKYNIITLPLLFTLNLWLAYSYESLTVTVIAIIISGIVIMPNYAWFRVAFFAGVFSFVALLYYLSPSLSLYKNGTEYNLFGDLKTVYGSNKLLQIDANSSWRMVLWYRVTVDKFPQNLLGIGLGTPLIEYQAGKDTADSNYDDEHDAHVIGVHNTYLTLFARLGVAYLLLTVLIYEVLFKEFYRYHRYYKQRGHYLLFIGFFAVSVVGLFNLVLESPTGASFYWLFLGLVAGAIFERQKNATLTSQAQHFLQI